MASHSDYHGGYSSDDSTFMSSRPRRTRSDYSSSTRPRTRSDYSNSTRPRPRRRPSSPSQAPPQDEKTSKLGGFGKVALGVVFVELVASAFSMWMKKRDDEREREHRRARKRDFERAKARRRREEERWERQQEERDRMEAEEWEVEEVPVMRRIGYVRADSPVGERSESRRPRRIASEPAWDDDADGWPDDAKQKKGRARSRPPIDAT